MSWSSLCTCLSRLFRVYIDGKCKTPVALPLEAQMAANEPLVEPTHPVFNINDLMKEIMQF